MRKYGKILKEFNSLTQIDGYYIKISVFVRTINQLCLTKKQDEEKYVGSPTGITKKSRTEILEELGLKDCDYHDISASIPCFKQAQYIKTTNQFEEHQNPRYKVYEKLKAAGEYKNLPLYEDEKTYKPMFKKLTLRSFFEPSCKIAWSHFKAAYTLKKTDLERNKIAFYKLYNWLWEEITHTKKPVYEEAKSFKCFLIESEVMNRMVLEVLKSGRLAVALYDCIYANITDEEFISLLKKHTADLF
jgi:hypothetical protein